MRRYLFRYGQIILREGKIITRTLHGRKINFFRTEDKQEIPLYHTKETLTGSEMKRYERFQARLKHCDEMLIKLKLN